MAVARNELFLPDLTGLRVVVAGDFVLDQYLYGCTDRISREAPVPIVRFEREEQKLGGAGNVAHNLAALGVRVEAVGLIGRDWAGRAVRELCGRAGIGVRRLRAIARLATPLKTRILAGALHTTRQQLLRLDRGRPLDSDGPVAEALEEALQGADALVVSDYGLGSAGAAVARLARAHARRLPVCVDSRYGLTGFPGVTVAKPNVPELAALAGEELADDATLARVAKRLLLERRWGCLLVTRGRDGLALFRRGAAPRFWPVHGPAEAVDVTGAGDTVLATFAAALAATGDPERAADLANVAGGLVVQKPGTATVSPAELAGALRER
ncbi:MAG: bifunctional heptose 7-phosphate kinase/heptose 1-phosphate adenyltransferase [Myxococcales bacterium]